MPSPRPVDNLIKRSLNILQNKYVAVGKERMSVLALSILVTFVAGMIAAVGLLASRSGTLQGSSAATTQVFQASTDFSGKQGQKGWYYLDEVGNPSLTYYASHAQCGPNPCWKGAEDYQLVLGMGQHPGPTKDSIRGWMAPGDGSVRITGKVADGGPPCGGDGVNVKIKQDPNILWQTSLSDGDATGKAFNVTSNVSSGQFIYFMVNKGSVNNYCDWTPFDPKIEFTPGGSGPPPPTKKTTTYKLSEQFSAGAPWAYMDGGRRALMYYVAGQHPECGPSACRHGEENFQIIGPGWMSPGHRSNIASPTVLEWQAPEAGYAKITGSVQLRQPYCSDGVEVDTPFNSKIVIPEKNGQAYPYTSEGSVVKGQSLTFKVSKGSPSQNNNCDTIVLDPTITFTQAVSVQPDLSIGVYKPTSAKEGAKVRFRTNVVVGAIAGTRQVITTNFYIDNVLIGSRKGRMSMRANSRGSFILPLSSAWTATKGTHTLRIVVDPDNVLAESDESNNTKTVTFVVGEGTASGGANRLTVKKVFLPGVSAAVTVKLDGALPSGTLDDTVYWDNVTAGSHTVSVTGAPKTFYAVCPGAGECLSTPQEGSTISYAHQAGKNDTVRLYFGSATTGIYDMYSFLGGVTPLKADAFDRYNFPVGITCEATIYTNAPTNTLLNIIRNNADLLSSKAGIKINFVYDKVIGEKAPILCSDKTGNDKKSVLRFGNFDLTNYCGERSSASGVTFYPDSLHDPNRPENGATLFHPDIIVDTEDPSYNGRNIDGIMSTLVNHEMGHLLGLEHSTDPNSIMNDKGAAYNHTQLKDVDIANLKEKYPLCAAKVKSKQPAKLSMTFSPNPAVWHLNSTDNKSQCVNGQVVVPNGYWSSYLTLKETSGSTGVTIEGAKIEQYGADGGIKKTLHFSGDFTLEAGGTIADSYHIPANKDFTLKKEVLTFFGKDDLGNAVQVTEALNFGGSHKLGSCRIPGGSGGGGGGGGGNGSGGGGSGWGGGGDGGSSSCSLDVCLEHEWGL